MRRTLAILAAAALAVAGLTVTAQPAHANIGPDVWMQAYDVVGPGADQTEATVRTLDCRTILVEEKRTDRATRYYRVEDNFPPPSAALTYPQTEHAIVVLPPAQGGWNVVRGWSTSVSSLDWERVVWVPPCADDRNPLT